MQKHDVKRVHKNIRSQSIGRGGKRGKTSGRGGKGQTARAGAKLRPEIRDFIKRLPKLRGRGKNIFTSIETKPKILNLDVLEKVFVSGSEVNPKTLLEKGLVKETKGKTPRVKILALGTISKKILVSGCKVSGSAKVKIEKAGGTVA